ncbi:OLC1v1030533C1 [Oldenlandia corymbosa var. corymbosa]|uniref:OLC1v1030533C1 n=1 Tax=Oldenlandia corymbosa var. corymbosa TaxID=529605 RepID=A0AAV1CHB4_OLDCO|nr:OLC1v1030533C1 [Oldenlandia corymbosa var. corymbosa]
MNNFESSYSKVVYGCNSSPPENLTPVWIARSSSTVRPSVVPIEPNFSMKYLEFGESSYSKFQFGVYETNSSFSPECSSRVSIARSSSKKESSFVPDERNFQMNSNCFGGSSYYELQFDVPPYDFDISPGISFESINDDFDSDFDRVTSEVSDYNFESYETTYSDPYESYFQEDEIKRKLTDAERNQILGMLEIEFQKGKPRHGTFVWIAGYFGVTDRTVRRIWACAKQCLANGERIEVERRSKRAGRNVLDLDFEEIKKVPLRRRSNIRSLANQMEIARSTLHRRIKAESSDMFAVAGFAFSFYKYAAAFLSRTQLKYHSLKAQDLHSHDWSVQYQFSRFLLVCQASGPNCNTLHILRSAHSYSRMTGSRTANLISKDLLAEI